MNAPENENNINKALDKEETMMEEMDGSTENKLFPSHRQAGDWDQGRAGV